MSRTAKRPNGEGHYRKRADGRYERQLTVLSQGKRKRVSVYGRDLRELSANTEELRRRLGAGWRPGSANISVQELTQRVLADTLDRARDGERSIGTYEQYRWLFSDYVIPEIGALAIGRVTEERCKDVLRRVREAGKSDQTRAHVFATMHRAFAFAVEQGWLASHPMVRLKKPTVKAYKAYVLSKDQARKFLVAASQEPVFDAALTTGLALGMRLVEVLAIRRRTINEPRGKLEVHSQLDRLPKGLRPSANHSGFVVVEKAKWNSNREPDLPPVAMKRLRAQFARQAARRLAAGTKWKNTVTVMANGRFDAFREEENDLLFTLDDGSPVDGKIVRDAFIRVCTNASIPHSTSTQHGLRIHDLRHSASSLLIEHGATAREVMALCGWKSPQVFLHYTQVEEQARARTAERMEKVLQAS